MKSAIAAALTAASILIALPLAAQDWAKAQLAKSTRHQEWVDVKNGDRTVHVFVVYPEVKTKATAVIMIHEIFGMSDWVQLAADEMAAAGYIAIAPDLLSGMGPNGGRSDSIEPSKVTEAVSKLPPDQVTGDLNAVADYAKKIPAMNGKLVASGFCWGGGQTFRFATNRPDITAALVFYGPPPAADAIKNIKAKVYGFYAENDARIDATIPMAETMMKDAGKSYEPVIYKGAGHGFMRAGDDPNGTAANKQAREDSWKRLQEILKKL